MRINNSHRLLSTPIPLLPKKYCCLQLLKPFFTPWKVIQWPESGKFLACRIWNPGLWTPKIQFKEFTMPLTIGIRNPSSTLKEYRIPLLESRIQDCLGSPDINFFKRFYIGWFSRVISSQIQTSKIIEIMTRKIQSPICEFEQKKGFSRVNESYLRINN